LRVFSDTVARITEPVLPFEKGDAQFIFAGYSWLKKDFRIWTIYYAPHVKRFEAREALSFHPRLRKAAFIGDWSTRVRSRLIHQLNASQRLAHLEPLEVLSAQLQSCGRDDTIGGPPQLLRITQHMNTRPLCVKWKDEDTLFGRPLFEYENVDYWIVEPFSGRFLKPRKFGYRTEVRQESDAVSRVDTLATE
jgi:hypothetical protein